jgi:hypothetical protein
MLSTMGRGIRALGRREFWSFRTLHALAGAALTVFGASEALFVNESIKKEVAGLDGQIAAAGERLAAIDRALFQFRIAQTNAIVMGVLSANDSLRPEFRKNMVELMFVTRRLPTLMMLQQVFPDDLAAFNAKREAYAGLIEKAKAAEDQADWNAVDAFEFEQESRLFEIEQQILEERDRLVAAKRDAAARLDFAIVLGFALQQVGFVVVLLAGLLYQHRQRPDRQPAAA